MSWRIGYWNLKGTQNPRDPIAFWENQYFGVMIPANWFFGYQYSAGSTLVICIVPPLAFYFRTWTIYHRWRCVWCRELRQKR